MFGENHWHDDPSTGREFAVAATDAGHDDVADDVAYSPFTGEPLEPDELTYPGEEPEADEEE